MKTGRHLSAYTVLVVSLVLAGVAAYFANQSMKLRALTQFREGSMQIKEVVSDRMREYTHALMQARGLFNVYEKVSRSEFRTYVENMTVIKDYPNAVGVGFAVRVPKSRLREHEESVRRAGFPDYRVRPLTASEDYTSVIFLEPFNARNRQALGFDLASEPIRKMAMDRARDSGEPAVSGLVKLLPKTSSTEMGFILYVPVYHHYPAPTTRSGRRRDLAGYLYSPFRAQMLFSSLLDKEIGRSAAVVEIYDGEPSQANLLYSKGAADPSAAVEDHPVEVAGRVWMLRMHQLSSTVPWPIGPALIALFGVVVSVGLFLLIRFIERNSDDLQAKQIELRRLAEDNERHFREAQEAVRRKEESMVELARSNADLEQFAYVASHDLKEPLRMVSSYVTLLSRRYKDKLDKDANEFIHFAVDGANRMHTLINDLLEFASVRKSGGEFAPTPMHDAAQMALKNLKTTAEEAQAEIKVSDLPTVIADRSQMVQLYQNLIGNALKYRSADSPKVEIGVQNDEDDWVFSVRDNGIGIDPEFKDRIFVIFQRLHGKDQYGGTGIGLSICKRIVERHGGRIWVESKPGYGATFRFTLPKRPTVSGTA